MTEQTDPIPESVIEALATVRATGRTNMLDRDAVIQIAIDADCLGEAIDWLSRNKTWYIEALRRMGEQRKKGAIS